MAIGLASEVIARVLVELLLYVSSTVRSTRIDFCRRFQFAVDRILLLFVSGGMLCLSCCLIFPLPETILYDLPDSLTDLQAMKRTTANDSNGEMSPPNTHYHMIDSNTLAFPPVSQSSNLNDLSSLSPKAMRSQQQQGASMDKSVVFRSPTDLGPSQSNASSLRALSNPCYFATLNNTIDRYDLEQRIDSHLIFSIQGVHNNNNNNNSEEEREDTRF